MLSIYKTFINEDGDETFTDGLHTWNISKLQVYIKESNIEIKNIPYKNLISYGQAVDKGKIDLVDLNQPIIIALYSDGRGILIDGIHRIRKAEKNNYDFISAYILPFDEHIKFLKNRVDFENFIEYDKALKKE